MSGTANILVRLPTAHDRNPEETGRLYLYLPTRAIFERVTGNFAFSFAELQPGTDSVAYRQHALRSLFTLLHTRKPVACVFERRPGLSVAMADALLEEMRASLDLCAYDQALMRSYYPQVSVSVNDKSNPGCGTQNKQVPIRLRGIPLSSSRAFCCPRAIPTLPNLEYRCLCRPFSTPSRMLTQVNLGQSERSDFLNSS